MAKNLKYDFLLEEYNKNQKKKERAAIARKKYYDANKAMFSEKWKKNYYADPTKRFGRYDSAKYYERKNKKLEEAK